MAHAVYVRGTCRNEVSFEHIGGFWQAIDRRTPGWSITGDTAREALTGWYEAWRDVKLNGW